MQQVKIENDMPMPTQIKKARIKKYPFDQLEVGQSFVAKVKKMTAYQMCLKHSKNTGKLFIFEQTGNNQACRIWRAK